MILYRGQAYGAPVGEWWTTERADAASYARVRGANRAWIVLAIHADVRKLRRWRLEWNGKRQTFRIPIKHLRQRILAARIVDGFLEIPHTEPAS